MLNSGDREKNTKFKELNAAGFVMLPLEESAFESFWGWQKAALAILSVLLIIGLVLWPIATLVLLNGIATLFYLFVVAFRFYTIHLGERTTGTTLNINSDDIAPLQDDKLPVYTILSPLYREPDTVIQFLRGMAKLDYPFEKLDVRILLEEDDEETYVVAKAELVRMGNPRGIEIVVVPDAQPKTKPKACNYGLKDARGEYAVIYDAEDIPEPDQLKKALIAFRRFPEHTVCVQAKLNYFNPNQNTLTRFFTAEYSMWFDLFLPGLFSVNAPIPLGGTSNHFKMDALLKLGAWDPFNVAEDADLGMRIARSGLTTGVIESTTWEEANSRVGNWIRQRSRWIKGYMQTWLVTMRHPLRVLKTLGPWRWFCFHMTVGGTAFVLLMNPVYWVLTLLYLLTAANFVPILFPLPVLVMSILTALIGNLTFIYLSMYGLMKRGYYGFVVLMFISPLYWILQSIAAWKALYQLFVKPHYWEKTEHNLNTAEDMEVLPHER